MLLVMVAVFLVSPSLVASYRVGSYDYCKANLCTRGRSHIACNNTETFSPKCGDDYFLLPMTDQTKLLILHWHNVHRNEIAKGKIDPYPSAQRMSVLSWDNELQYLATLNVKRCQLAHDECRNTRKFKYVGQNIGIRRTWPNYEKHPESIKKIVTAWFNEHVNANKSFIESFGPHPVKGKKIGHFTAMVGDNTVKIGCACILFTNAEKQKKCFLMTCNYSSANFKGRAVYTPGETGSACKEGKSPRFDGLCSFKEKAWINPRTGLLN